MKQRFSRVGSVKFAGALALCVAASLVLAPTLAVGSAETNPATTVYIKDGKKGLRFVSPEFINSGESLTVLNQTNAHRVGPHTLSLVEPSLVPKTRKARQRCFTPKHICMAIARWHGVKGNGPVKQNPAKAGEAGWDTMGSLSAKGDSWFTGIKANASFSQAVSAPAGTTLTFLCAIHPWMHGKIEVRTPPTI